MIYLVQFPETNVNISVLIAATWSILGVKIALCRELSLLVVWVTSPYTDTMTMCLENIQHRFTCITTFPSFYGYVQLPISVTNQSV